MAFLMFVIIAACLVAAYFLGKRDLLSPWFLMCLAVFVSYCIVLFNYKNWDVRINGTFVLYIGTALVAFGLGGALMRAFCPRYGEIAGADCRLPAKEAQPLKRYPELIFIFVSGAAALLYCGKMLYDAGFYGSLGERIRRIYENVVANDYSPGFFFNQMLELVVAVAYINTYRLFQEMYTRKRVSSMIKLAVPLVFFMLTVTVSSDRNIFLRYAFYAICMYVLFFRENTKKKHVNLSIVKKVAILLLLLMGAFFLLGKTKQYSSGLLKSLSIYGGSGLYDFNLWIKDFDAPLLYGQSTFSTFLNTLNTLFKGFGVRINATAVDRIDPFIEFTAANGYEFSSNIYTALKPYVEDFGYVGVIIFPLAIGAFYEWLFLRMKRCKYGFSWVIYCMLIYPIIFFPILEQLVRRFHLGFIYELFWVAVVYFVVYGKKRWVLRRSVKQIEEVRQ